MKKGKLFLTALLIGIASGGILQAGVTVTYKGPELSNLVNPKEVDGFFYIGKPLHGVDVDLHNSSTNEHFGMTYLYQTNATTIGPVKYSVNERNSGTKFTSCTSDRDDGKIPINQGQGAKQKTLTKLIVNLTASPSNLENTDFKYSCSVDAKYE